MGASRFPVFQERFRELRGELTQEQFAKMLGISRPTVGLYESGTRIPDAQVLSIIASKCGTTADYLLGLCDEKSPSAEIRTICWYTGLNETTLERLHWYVSTHENSDFNRKAINCILSNAEMYSLLNALLLAVKSEEADNNAGMTKQGNGLAFELPSDAPGKVTLSAMAAREFFEHYAEMSFQCIVQELVNECATGG